LIIENGRTIRLTRQSAIANENRNQFVTVCNCLSSVIDAHTNKLPSVPNIANIDKPNTGQFSSFAFVEVISFVQFVVNIKDIFGFGKRFKGRDSIVGYWVETSILAIDYSYHWS
jgi:hypothetical protein